MHAHSRSRSRVPNSVELLRARRERREPHRDARGAHGGRPRRGGPRVRADVQEGAQAEVGAVLPRLQPAAVQRVVQRLPVIENLVAVVYGVGGRRERAAEEERHERNQEPAPALWGDGLGVREPALLNSHLRRRARAGDRAAAQAGARGHGGGDGATPNRAPWRRRRRRRRRIAGARARGRAPTIARARGAARGGRPRRERCALCRARSGTAVTASFIS